MKNLQRFQLIVALFVSLFVFNSLGQTVSAAPSGAYTPVSPAKVFFPECGHYLSNGFLYFWRGHGRYDLLGCPITEEMSENGRTVQYFEKARLEYHPDLAGTPWETSLGLLGTEIYLSQTPDQLANPGYAPIEPFVTTKTRAFFPATNHSVGGGFYEYWKANGGLYIFGNPISEEYPQQFDGVNYSVQDFERTRFFYSPKTGVQVGTVGRTVAILKTVDTTALLKDAKIPDYSDKLYEHWVDVNLSKFTATYMEGDLAMYTATVISGKKGFETPTGTFRIWSRIYNEHMKGGAIGSEDYYDLDNVLFTQYFTYEGHALHYAWWRSSFGYQASHGCVNMNYADSEFAWNWLKIGSAVNIHY